ncbi:MAG: ATP-binding protein [Clostridium sp.]
MLKRAIKPHVVKALDMYPVVILTGSMQVGKSTLAYEFVKEKGFAYVSLDNIDQRKLAISDPKYFLQQFDTPLIIDEVQYAPVLFEVIEEIVNRKRLETGNANGMYLLTGSQAFHLMKNVTQSLAGRASVIQMVPLGLDEILGRETLPFVPSKDRIAMYQKSIKISVKDVFELITKGMYPELYRTDQAVPDYYENYVNTYIDRDISELIHLKDKLKFHDFLQYLAALTGQQINASDLSRKLQVSSNTIQHWLSILESTGLIYFLQPYNDISITKRVVKSSKVYFSDTGLAAYLIKMNYPETLRISNLSGAFFETFVVNEIRKTFLNNKEPFHAYYYRDSKQNEIDLVLLYKGRLSLIEIKQGVSFQASDVKGFDQLKSSLYQIENRIILCNTLENYPINRDVQAVALNSI